MSEIHDSHGLPVIIPHGFVFKNYYGTFEGQKSTDALVIYANLHNTETIARLNAAPLQSLVISQHYDPPELSHQPTHLFSRPGLYVKVSNEPIEHGGADYPSWRRVLLDGDVVGSGGSGFSTQRHIVTSGVTSWQTIDAGVLTSKVSSANYSIVVRAGSSVEKYDLSWLHDGTETSTASVCDLEQPLTVKRIGSPIYGVEFGVLLNGAAQKVSLLAKSENPARFEVSMYGWTQHSAAALSIEQLEGLV